MKKLLPIVLCLSAVASAAVTMAGPYPSIAMRAKMEECFRLHHQLMEKPAVRSSVWACWYAHGYLMDRQTEVKDSRKSRAA